MMAPAGKSREGMKRLQDGGGGGVMPSIFTDSAWVYDYYS